MQRLSCGPVRRLRDAARDGCGGDRCHVDASSFAPTLIRSQALAKLYEAAHKGEISAAEVSSMFRASLPPRSKFDSLETERCSAKRGGSRSNSAGRRPMEAEYVALTTMQ